MRYFRCKATFLFVVFLVDGMHAQDCADWSTSITAPTFHPEIAGSDLLAFGDLLVVVNDGLEVYDASQDGIPLMGSCVLPAVNGGRIRVIDQHVYVALGEHGLWRIDLKDPTKPTCSVIFDPNQLVNDMAAFDSGVVVVTGGSGPYSSGTVYVFDGLEQGQLNLLSRRPTSFPVRHVDVEGSTAAIGGSWGVAAVDLVDPRLPVLTVFGRCLEVMNARVTVCAVAVDDDRIVAAVQYFVIYDGPTFRRLEVYDRMAISATREPSACIPIGPYMPRRIFRYRDHLVAFTGQYIEFRTLEDLALVTSLAVPIPSSDITYINDRIFAVSPNDGMVEYNVTNVHLTNALSDLQSGYDPSRCGRFGMAEFNSTTTNEEWGNVYVPEHTYRHVAIYDQSDPLSPALIYELLLEPSVSLTRRAIVAQNDRWAVLRSYWEDEFSYSYTSMSAISDDGAVFSLSFSPYGWAVFDGDILWTLHSQSVQPEDILTAYDMSGPEPVLLSATEYDLFGNLWALRERLYVSEHYVVFLVNGEINTFDCSNPASPIRLETYTPSSSLGLPALFVDGLLYAPSGNGLDIFEVTPEISPPITLRGGISLGDNPSVMSLNGDLLAVRIAPNNEWSWQILSVEDPDNPMILSPLIVERGYGFAWAGNHLYVNAENVVYQYDVSNPADPVWGGQSSYNDNTIDLCVRGDYLMDGDRVLPLDCDDLDLMARNTDVDHAAPPPAVAVLHPVSPNPFNPRTVVRFDLADEQHVVLKVHDMRGRLAAILADGLFGRGPHHIVWTGSDQRGRSLPSGSYILRLVAGASVHTTKAVLIR